MASQRTLDAAIIIVNELTAENERLRNEILEFGGHLTDCRDLAGEGDCDCGWDEISKRIKG